MSLQSVSETRLCDNRKRAALNPEVSVIIPVYNAMPYVIEAVESVLSQEGVCVELICVDDGSTDGGPEELAKYLVKFDRFSLVLQDNSGSPSSPRNVGIERARGKYLYFLDADDLLFPDSLRKLFEEAETTGNSHVLGKIRGIGGREALPQIFKKTNHDADLLGSYAWHNLSPTGKLIKKSEVDKLNLRFNEDQWVGEDQVFFAELYLSSHGISILADQDYVGYRLRDDGDNITTSRRQSLRDKQMTVCRLSDVIQKYCEESRSRDLLAQRIFTSTLPGVFNGIYQSSKPIEKAVFAKNARASLLPVLSKDLKRRIDKRLQVILDILLLGELDDVDRYIRYSSENGVKFVRDEEGLILDTSELSQKSQLVVDRSLPAEGILSPKLTAVTVSQAVGLETKGCLNIAGIDILPDKVQLVLRERGSGEEILLDGKIIGTKQKDRKTTQLDISLSVAADAPLHAGAWGTFVRCTWGKSVTEARWGKRTNSIPNEKLYFKLENGRDVVSYFNAVYENLTVDVDGTVHSQATIATLKSKAQAQT